MTTCPSIEALAAFVEDEQDLTSLHEHVVRCAHCQEVVAGFRSDRDLLRSWPEVPDDALVSVRGAVMTQLENRKRVRFAWIAAVAAGMSLAVLVPSFLSDHAGPPAKVAPSEERVSAPVPFAQALEVPLPKPRKTRRPRATGTDSGQELIAALDRMYEPERPVATAPEGTVVLTLPTKDPNVMIVLFDDSIGGTE